MEDWQYIKKVPVSTYFVGKGLFKYRGDINQSDSSANRFDFFDHLSIYDFEVSDIKKISKDEFDLLPRIFIFDQITNDLTGKVNNISFKLTPAYLFAIGKSQEELNRRHTIVENGEVHGYFEPDVAFEIVELEDRVFRKEGYPTGVEIRDEELKRTHVEYYTSDCKTKWKWDDDNPEKVSETMQETRGLEEAEETNTNAYTSSNYGNSDSTEKRKHQFKETNHKNTFAGMFSSLLGVLGILSLAAFILFTIIYNPALWLAIGIVALILFLLNWSRFEFFVIRIVRVIGYIVTIGSITMTIFGVVKLFSSSLRIKIPYEWELPDLDFDDTFEFEFEDPDSSSNVANDTIIYHNRTWYDYVGNKYEGRYGIRYSDIERSEKHLDSLRKNSWNLEYAYEETYNYEKGMLYEVYNMFDSINQKRELNQLEFAEMVVSFVQDISYVLILEDSCDSTPIGLTESIEATESVPCEGGIPFGLNTPLQFLASLDGDCDSRTLLIYTILKHYKYDVAILNSEAYYHSMIGINLPYSGRCLDDKLIKYYFWETTAKGFKPGIISNQFGNINYWHVALN